MLTSTRPQHLDIIILGKCVRKFNHFGFVVAGTRPSVMEALIDTGNLDEPPNADALMPPGIGGSVRILGFMKTQKSEYR